MDNALVYVALVFAFIIGVIVGVVGILYYRKISGKDTEGKNHTGNSA